MLCLHLLKTGKESNKVSNRSSPSGVVSIRTIPGTPRASKTSGTKRVRCTTRIKLPSTILASSNLSGNNGYTLIPHHRFSLQSDEIEFSGEEGPKTAR
jgi:hypothetical protein